jgi:peptidoglycan/LPS O-acetylase OafA/YrhL
VADLGVAVRPADGGGRHRSVEHNERVTSLDGLRGIAALVVLVHHTFLTQPGLAAPYLDPTPSGGGLDWWLTYTPLHLVWAGTEAVFVFFVLSGLVLALPAVKNGGFNLRGYYPRRLLRLYLPVWAAIALAVLLATAVPRIWKAGDSWWLPVHGAAPTVDGALWDALLLVSPGSTNYVLWSLQWEVIYCLALPLVLVAARAFPKMWPVKVLAVLGALVIGASTDSLAVSSLSFFALGTLMAVEYRRLQSWASGIQGRRHPAVVWWLALCGGLGLLLSYWFFHATTAAGSELPQVADAFSRGLQAVGACLLIFIVWQWPAARRAMTSRVAQWLGTRSFSLYLVHLPVVLSVALILGGQPALVEHPSHQLARRVGRALTRRPKPAEEAVSSQGDNAGGEQADQAGWLFTPAVDLFTPAQTAGSVANGNGPRSAEHSGPAQPPLTHAR